MGTDVEIAVVGSGAVAAATAWHLARGGRDVVLLPGVGEARTVADVVVPSRPGRPGVGVGRAAAAAPLWRRIEAETGAELLHLTGAVDHGDIVATALVAEALAAHGHHYTWLTPEDAEQRWPGMRFRGPVLHQPDRTGWIRAGIAVRAVRAAAVGRGATVAPPTWTERVVVRGDRAVVVHDGGRVRARRVVVAAGAETGRLLGGRPVARVREVPDVSAAFPLLSLNPCVARLDRWPGFTHHPAPRDGLPGPVHGTPDPCGDVVVGFAGAREKGDAALRAYVAEHLPGLDPTRPIPIAGTRVESVDGRSVVVLDGPVAVGAGFAGSATAYAPALGRVLADLVRR